MNKLHLINSIRVALKRIALAVPLGAAMWLAAGPSAHAIPTDSLIHYDFDSVSGATVTNTGSLGSAADGTLQNATLVAGQYGNALSFTGSSSGVRTNNTVAIGNAFTLACWVSTTNSNGGYHRIIMNDYVNSSYLGTGGGTAYLTIVKNLFKDSPQSVDTTGAWHHLAMTWDGTSQRFYYDGALVSGYPTAGNSPTTLTQKFGFGCNSGAYSEPWNGKMDDAFVFGRALSLAEVQSLYTNAPNTAPAVPTSVAATPVSSGTVSVSWVADTNAASRTVSVIDTTTSIEQLFNTAAATSYSVTGLTNGILYNFKVLATNALGSSAYSSTVSATPTLSTAKNILTFLVPGQPDGVISGTNISVVVPTGTNVTAFSPTYTVSNLASGSPVSGTTRNFTSPQTYTITAEDLSTQDYTVTVTEGTVASIYTWTTGTSGNWSDPTKWTNDLSNGLRPGTFGQSYYTLNFNQAVTATNNLSASYVVNQLNFGSTVTLAGNSLALTSNGATLPAINQNSGNQVAISTPLSLAANTTLGGSNTGTVVISSNITGPGSLTKSNGGQLTLTGTNTLTGGINIGAGTVYSTTPQNDQSIGPIGSANVTIQSGATLRMERGNCTGTLTLNGGSYSEQNGFNGSWNGSIVLTANSFFPTSFNLTVGAVVSGAGGFTKSQNSALNLNAINTYFGPTIISAGSVTLGSAGSIDNTSLISIAAGATFDVSAKTANFALTSNNSLSASGAVTAATLKGKSGGTVDLGSRPVSLTYNALNPALTVSQGTLVLNGNPFTVNTASALAVGTYNIATQTTGSITSSGTYPGVVGTAIAAGRVGSISVSGSNVVLTISVPTLEVAGFPGSQVAGVAGSVTVTAKDGAGNTASGFTGTVAFTSTDGAATLPANYTFVSGDNGVHTFTSGVTLRTVAGGTKSITATAVGTPATTGTQSGITVTPAPAATLTVSGFPASKTAGAADNVTITAKDAFNNVATGYTGTVAITSTDGAAVLPANYTFVGGDNGTKVRSVTLNTVSGATVAITATDTVTGTITGTQSGIIVLPNTSAATLQVTGFPSSPTAGVAGSVTVTAKTSGGATATTYTGTVHFTSSDGAATLPSNYTFVAGDNGVHTFTGGVTLTTAAGGAKSITATDTTTLITGSQFGITVNPAAAATLVVSGYPSPQFAGTAGNVTVTAKDIYNNTATGYTGTVAFTSTDGAAALPSNYTFVGGDSGVHTFTGGVTFATAGTQSITATDTVTGAITGSQSGITVNLVPSIFTWTNAVAGFWADATKWTNDAAIFAAPDTAGKSNYVLNFTQAGTYTTTHDLTNGFLMNRLNFGGAVTLAGSGVTLTNNGAALPQINQNSGSGVTISNSVSLAADVTVAGSGNGQVTLAGVISGGGSLTKSNSGTLLIRGISPPNTYSGGTIINGGTLSLGYFDGTTTFTSVDPLGSGPVTLNGSAVIECNKVSASNALIVNGGKLANYNGWGSSWSGSVTLNATLTADMTAGEMQLSGGVSGVGGITKIGGNSMKLSGINDYTGNTTVSAGTVALLDNGGLKFVLADAGGSNKVTGAGTATLDGDFTIDTTAVTVTTGTWTLVDTATKSFGSTFTVVDFTPNGDGVTWVMTGAGKTWTFVETTGVLTLTVSGSDYDTWIASFTSITAPADKLSTADPDGDGLTNQQEYAFGLSPASGASVNPITVPLDVNTGMFTYTRRATPLTTGLTYTVQTSTDLVAWPTDVTASENVTGTVGDVETVEVTLSAAIPLTAPTTFVRVKATP